MALITEDRAREIVTEDRDYILEARYPEDLSAEYAESHTPIYDHAIYEMWGDLPAEARDLWREYEMTVEDTISGMRLDLYYYIDGVFSGAIARLIESTETN